MLKKIWSDSVWSKVIASAIIGLLTLTYLKFESVSKKISFKDAFDKILEIKISAIYVIGIILLFLIVKSIIKKVFKSEKSYYSRKQKKLREFNKITDIEIGLMYKWSVYFKQNGTPFISDLTGFCTKHNDAPLRLINSNCPMTDCNNHRINLDEYRTENHIESLVINQWDLINK
jgi:hypothetical protein